MRVLPGKQGSTPPHSRGFTLLEVIIAIAIFAMVSAMAYSGLANVLRSRERVEAERATWRTFTMLYLRLEDDLAEARPRTIRDGNGVTLPAMQGQATDTRALGAPALEFTRGGIFLPPTEDADPSPTAAPPPVQTRAARSDMQRVAYRLSEGKLWRLTWPDLDRGPQSLPQESPLLDDVVGEVQEFQVRFYANKDGWVNSWPPLAANGTIKNPMELPRGVEVRLVLKGRGEFKRLFLIHE
jgi:general secretion pathway protein J